MYIFVDLHFMAVQTNGTLLFKEFLIWCYLLIVAQLSYINARFLYQVNNMLSWVADKYSPEHLNIVSPQTCKNKLKWFWKKIFRKVLSHRRGSRPTLVFPRMVIIPKSLIPKGHYSEDFLSRGIVIFPKRKKVNLWNKNLNKNILKISMYKRRIL